MNVKEAILKRRSIRKILHLTDNIVPLGLLHVGYPDEEKEPRTQYETKKVHYIE